MAMVRRVLRVLLFGFVLQLANIGWALDGVDERRNLSPKEKENILRNYQRWQNLPSREKEHLKDEWNRWQNLPQDRRDRLRRRYDELPQQRQKR